MQLFGPDGNVVDAFKDVDELVAYINGMENAKFAESPSCISERAWNFVLFTNKRLSYVGCKTLERSFSKTGREAFERELDLIEISKGNDEERLQIPVTPDIDIQELKKNWCSDYCDAHGYVLVDCQDRFETPCSLVDTLSAVNVMNGFSGELSQVSQ